MPAVRAAAAPVLLLLAAACTPTLDWREVRPDGSGLVALLPCKPSAMTRKVQLAGRGVLLSLSACNAGDATWAIATADVEDPAQVAPALTELRRAAAANLAVSDGSVRALPLRVPGATPSAAGGRVAFAGKLPDATPASEQLALFVKGTRVFQATVLGAAVPADAAETFFTSLRLP